MITKETQTIIKGLIEIKVFEKVKIVSKEKLHSDKIKREYGKIYIDDGTDTNKFLCVFRNYLIEKLDELKEDVWYNFSYKQIGNFLHLESWERWDCSFCKKIKIKKLLVGANNRTFVLKSIFEGQMNLWKSQMPKTKTISLDVVEEIFKNIVEELDKDFNEQTLTLESLSDD